MINLSFPFIDAGDGILAAGAVVELQAADGSWHSWQFLLDTGADSVSLPASIAKQLGLSPMSGTLGQVQGVDDQSIVDETYTVGVRLQGMTDSVQASVTVLPDEFTPLLGRLGVWGILFSSILIDCVAKQTTFTVT